jgi:uncharacterized integral membrane protein
MWIFRYFLPGTFAVALGFFVAQNLDEKISLRFLFWRFYDVPLILIIAITVVIAVFIRYYVIFVKWMDKERLKRETKKIIRAHKAEEDLKVKKDYSEDIEEMAEERMRKRIAEQKKAKDEEESENENSR